MTPTINQTVDVNTLIGIKHRFQREVYFPMYTQQLIREWLAFSDDACNYWHRPRFAIFRESNDSSSSAVVLQLLNISIRLANSARHPEWREPIVQHFVVYCGGVYHIGTYESAIRWLLNQNADAPVRG